MAYGGMSLSRNSFNFKVVEFTSLIFSEDKLKQEGMSYISGVPCPYLLK
jgi:hypothetical protein